MNAVLLSVLVVSAVCLVSAHGPGGRGPPPGGKGRGGHGHRGPPPGMMMKFESCKSFNGNMTEKMKEMMEAQEIGPEVCKGEREDCMKADAIKVRCAIEAPSDECMQDFTNFMSGNMCEFESADTK